MAKRRGHGSYRRGAALLAVLCLCMSCRWMDVFDASGHSGSAPHDEAPDTVSVPHLNVHAAQVSPFFLGPTDVRVEMRGRRQADSVATAISSSWAVRDTSIARLTPDNTIRAVREGLTTVVATADGVSDSAEVRVTMAADTGFTVIAHRGFARLGPENTLEAFANAFDHGARIVETDVRLTADSVPILMHDYNVDRTTNGHGAVAQLMSGQIHELNACEHEGLRHMRWWNCHVPTLHDALTLVRERQGRILVEIKDGWTPAGIDILLREMAATETQGRVMFTSFDSVALSLVRARDERVALGLLATRRVPLERLRAWRFSAVLYSSGALGGESECVAYVEAARGQGIDVAFWTISGPIPMTNLLRRTRARLIADIPLVFFPSR